MTSKERLTSALFGLETDRVAWAPELNAYFVEVQLKRAGKDPKKLANSYVEANKLIGSDTLLGGSAYKTEYTGGIEVSEERTNGELTRTIITPVGKLRSRSRFHEEAGTFFMYEPFVKGKEDYARYQYYIEHWKVVPQHRELEETIRVLGEDGIVSLNAPASPLMHFIMDDMGVENALFQIFDYEKELSELMDVMHEKFKEIYRVVANAPGAVVVRPFEDTSTTLTSPGMFEKYCLPRLIDYARILHDSGKMFVPHLCGHLKDVLGLLARANIDGIEALTPPPTGNTYPRVARAALPDAVLIGGIDATEFSTLSGPRVLAKVEEVLESMRGDRKFILGNEEISVRANFEAVLGVSRMLRERVN